jgi:hypothetical protein
MFQRVVLLLVLCLCSPGTCLKLQGQPSNAWISLSSGNWEDMNWSLGQLPAPGQDVLLTNAGWKAISIGAATVQNFPQTLNPASVVLSSPTNSYNLLLLNYAGFQSPLSVQQLVINSNAALTSLSSALNVNNSMGGAFSVGGALNQGDYSVVSASGLHIGDVGPGVYNLTNGTLLVTVTQAIGGNFSALFNQFGGDNYPGNVLLLPGGEYDLYGGSLTTSNLIYRGWSGSFKQFGGSSKPTSMFVTLGSYLLAGGTFACSDVELPGVTSIYDYADLGNFLQTGGTNFTGLLSVGHEPPYNNASAWGGYTLSNGVLITSDVSIGPYGDFAQSGGWHTVGALGLYGDIVDYYQASTANYELSGGWLSTPGLGLGIAVFTQTGGTNQIAGDLAFESLVGYGTYTEYNLSGGLLVTSNTTVNGSMDGGFFQTGGAQIVSNLLTVSGSNSENYGYSRFAGYVLSGGQLTTKDIRVDSGATFHHTGGVLINNGTLTLASGTWEANTDDQQFGALWLGLGQGGSNSSVCLPSGAAILRFANSSGNAWSNQASLIIENWNGSPAGGGAHQIYFGANAGGLSSPQLAQVQFHNPGGIAGTYPATILPTGEIVPARFLASRQSGASLVFSWAPGMVLQASANVAGPYEDIAGATSPYTVSFTGPRRFFRLR